AAPKRLKCTSPRIRVSTPVWAVIAAASFGVKLFRVNIGGTTTTAIAAIAVIVAQIYIILRRVLGFNAIFSFLVFLL
ncbi:MAG: hypothetical protein K2I81_02235, partial [Alphaproteobacteria bacterium]|nr:hypothetical protein [Alphaproteobacteria bacterium]